MDNKEFMNVFVKQNRIKKNEKYQDMVEFEWFFMEILLGLDWT